MKKIYHTQAREAILDTFRQSPEKIYTSRELLDKAELNISPPSVYRLLSVLTREGLLEKFQSEGSKGAGYRLNACGGKEHFHLKCDRCGRLICADCDFLFKMTEHFNKEHGFSLDPEKTVLVGRCDACEKRDKD